MTKTKENTNVVSLEDKLPVDMSIMEQDANSGLEGITQEDLATPRLKILMQLSPELEENKEARAGMIMNTVTGDLYDGEKGIVVVPVAYNRQYVEWSDRGQSSGAPVNVYDADSDILSKTTRDQGNKDRLDNGNYVDVNANHFILYFDAEGNPQPALVTMKITQLKKSRRWNSMMLNLKIQGSKGPFTPPSYSHKYKLKIVKEKNDLGTWYGWDVERVGPVESKSVYEMAKSFAGSIKSGEVKAKPDQDAQKSNVPFE